jgi:hypothetical protein
MALETDGLRRHVREEVRRNAVTPSSDYSHYRGGPPTNDASCSPLPHGGRVAPAGFESATRGLEGLQH